MKIYYCCKSGDFMVKMVLWYEDGDGCGNILAIER
jgi:hypothetical protein